MRDVERNVASAPLQDDHIQQLADESLRRVLRSTVSVAIFVIMVRLLLLSIARSSPSGALRGVLDHLDTIDLVGAIVVLWMMLVFVARERRAMEGRLDDEIEAIRHRERERAVLDIEAMVEAGGGELAKDVDRHGRLVYRTRGRDPAGVAEGGQATDLDREAKRIQAWEVRPEHEGLEGPLTRAEEVVVEADERRAMESAAAWERKEKADPDLIEAGVERLGDLLAGAGVPADPTSERGEAPHGERSGTEDDDPS